MSGEQQEFDDLAEFTAYLDEREANRGRKDRKRPDRPDVQEIGEGPAPKQGPFCHLCRDTRRLLPDVLKLSDGRKAHLCRTCQKQVKWDRAHRCIGCGAHSETRLLNSGGVCPKCVSCGVEAQQNLVTLIRVRWIGVIRGD